MNLLKECKMKQLSKKVLDVDKNPFLHSYFHTASFLSIISDKVRLNKSDVSVSHLQWKYSDGIKSDFTSEIGYNSKNTIFTTIPKNISESDDSYDIYLGEFDGIKSDSCLLFNSTNNIESFSFKLNAMKEICRWSMVGIEISKADTDGSSEILFRAMFSPMNFINIEGSNSSGKFSYRIENTDQCKYMKLGISSKLVVSISNDGDSWNQIFSEKNYISGCSARIGLFSWIGEDTFQNWFYSNYIQLHAGKELEPVYDVKLDYYMGIKRLDMYNNNNPWVIQSYVEPRLVSKIVDICDFIKACIDVGKYVSIMLNEKYIPYSFAYNKFDYDHQSLIYGYDEDKRIIYCMGYDKHQHYVPFELTYDIFIKAYAKITKVYKILISEYTIPEFYYRFDVNLMIKMLNEYKSNVDSSYREEFNINGNLRFFGIQIYDICLSNIQKMRDQRISYIINEHKKIMVSRIKYLKGKGVLNNSDYMRLHEMSVELEKLSSKLILFCVKYRIKADDKMLSAISEYIAILKKKDMIFIEEFIRTLDDYRKLNCK